MERSFTLALSLFGDKTRASNSWIKCSFKCTLISLYWR